MTDKQQYLNFGDCDFGESGFDPCCYLAPKEMVYQITAPRFVDYGPPRANALQYSGCCGVKKAGKIEL